MRYTGAAGGTPGIRIQWSAVRHRRIARGRSPGLTAPAAACALGSHSARSIARGGEYHPLAGTKVCEILRPKQRKGEQLVTGAAVGLNDAWDLQDRAKRVAIKGRVRAEGKVRRLAKRPRKDARAVPGYREGLLDFERDARRRDRLLVGRACRGRLTTLRISCGRSARFRILRSAVRHRLSGGSGVPN